MFFKSGITIVFFTLVSRLFGLARELFIAATFGSGQVADSINVAFKLPNFFRRIFGEGALSVVFIPMYSDKLVNSRQSARVFSGEIFTLLFITLCIITLLMQLFMPYLMMIIAPGFYVNKEKYELSVLLCRITTPYLIFVSVAALFGGMLNSIRKFAAFAFVPIILNITVIANTLLLEDYIAPEFGIASSLIVAGILQVSFMFYCLHRHQLSFPLLFRPKDKDVRKLLRNMAPAAMSSGTQQLNLFISQSIASFLPGAVSILSYADRLYQLPLALIGITFGTILLPELSRIYKKHSFDEANFLQNQAIQIAMTLSIPAMIGLFVLSHPIIHIIYERGEFSAVDTSATANALAAFSLGLPAYVLAKILTPIFYANLDTKTPFRITLYSLVVNTSLNIALMIPFGYVGIAAGSSIAAWFNVYLLIRHAKDYGDFRVTKETLLFSSKIIFCASIMGVMLYFIDIKYAHLFYGDKILPKIIFLLLTISTGIVVFGTVGFVFKLHNNLIKKYDKN